MLREEFRILKLTFHSDLRRRAASRLALPCTSSYFCIFTVRRYALHGLSHRNSVRPSVCPSVRLSVRLSVTLVHCVHMVRPTIMISSPHGSPIILVSGISRPSQNSKGVPRAIALNEGGVGTNWRFSTNKSPYLRNGARYDKGYY